MTGTDKILQHIAEKAQGESQEIMDKARQEAARLREASQAKQLQIREESEKQGRQIIEEAQERARTAAETYKRRTLLSARGALVKEALTMAYQHILALPDEEYFAFLYSQLDKQDLNREGSLSLNARDLERRPADFEKRIAAAANKQGGRLTLAPFDVPMDGGFILNYGGIQENCSLEAIFESEADVLKDAVRAVLFEG